MRIHFLFSSTLIVLIAAFFFSIAPQSAQASTNISATTTDHWAWSDVMGWIDFYTTDTITVSSQEITGYASSSIGDISLDCTTTRNGNICGQSNYGITNDGLGNLSGWGWNDTIGWISFDCNNTGTCATSNYRVYIDATGYFRNYAWNDTIGWISFNCADGGFCGISNYKVATSWQATSTSGTLESRTIDTQATSGVKLNSILWRGTQPLTTAVRFQFAMSNSSSGPWNYQGSDGTASTYYTVDPAVSLPLDRVFHNDMRYFRYKVFLISDQAQLLTPHVEDIIVNWSP